MCVWQTLEEIKETWSEYKAKLGGEFEWLKDKLKKYKLQNTIEVVEAIQSEIEQQDANHLEVELRKVPTIENLANLLTKHLAELQMKYLPSKMGYEFPTS